MAKVQYSTGNSAARENKWREFHDKNRRLSHEHDFNRDKEYEDHEPPKYRRPLWTFSSIAIVLTLTLTLAPPGAEAGTKADLYNLHHYLFNTGYEDRIRPVANDSFSLYVYLSFSLLSLVDVNEKDQTLVSNALLHLTWSDYLLSWNSSEYGGWTTFLVQQQDIWLPDIQVGNSVRLQKQLGYDELPVRIDDTGDIEWSPTVVMYTSCDIDVTYYPMDTQICYIVFETSASKSHEIDLDIDRVVPISLVDYNEDGQWEIVDTGSENLPTEKTKIRFALLLKRRRTYYVVNLLVPVIFLSLTSSLVFALPADAGEKMSMGMTVLLAYAVYLTIISDYLPNTSVQTSILAVYLTTLLGITAVSVIIACLVLRLHFRPADNKVGQRTRKFIVFLKTITFNIRRSEKNSNAVFPQRDGPSPPTTISTQLTTYESDTDPWSNNSSGNNGRSRSAKQSSGKKEYEKNPPPEMSRPVSSPVVYLDPMTWQEVAAALDWFLFLAVTAITWLLTIIVLVVLIEGAERNKPKLPSEFTTD